jgi:DNA-binding response OmpR family regulator
MTTETIGTLLTIDDEQGIREYTAAFAESLGFKVLTAGDGVEAQEVLKTQTPDIIVSDMSMPRMDGMTLLSEIRKTGSHPLFLFISAFTSYKYTVKALSLGAYDYLEKPFMPKHLQPLLLDMLRVQVERKRLLALPLVAGQSVFGATGPEFEILKLTSIRSPSQKPLVIEPEYMVCRDHKQKLTRVFSSQIRSQVPHTFASLSAQNNEEALSTRLGRQFRLMHSIRLTGTALELPELDGLCKALEETYILLRVRPNYLNKMTLSTLKTGQELLISQIQTLAEETSLSTQERSELHQEISNIVQDLNNVIMS